MQSIKGIRWMLALTVLAAGLSACEKTPSQKVEDKAEDAAHEMKQATERVGEDVKDATK